MNNQDHWQNAYTTKERENLGWFQAESTLSLSLVGKYLADKNANFIDIGGGASGLLGDLASAGYKQLTLLDLSQEALTKAKAAWGKTGEATTTIAADVLTFEPAQKYQFWHDRACFHFLVEEENRKAYLQTLLKSLEVGGYFLLSTFAIHGPIACSGLPVRRYDAALALAEFGENFDLLEETFETHKTPWDKEQKFVYMLFKRTS